MCVAKIKLLNNLLYKKVRLKYQRIFMNRNNSLLIYFLFIFSFLNNFNCVNCNHPPRFMIEGHSEIVLRLKEGPETPITKPIYRLKGYDQDGDDLEFGIRASYDSDIIRIVPISGTEANIFLTKLLDRETKDEYNLVLTLTDNKLGDGNFVMQSFLLLVEDINDNEPIFKPFQSAIEVPENSRHGILTTVEATDSDEGANGQVVYFLEELEGDNDVFTITTMQGKGVIRLVKDLDYEKKNLYQLRVTAKDRANQSQGKVNMATVPILVRVKDIEDQPPEFIVVTPVARVPEDAPIGTHILRVKAMDGDRGVNNRIRYAIVRGGDNLFDIDQETGTIFVKNKLDREDMKNQANGAYILQIAAYEISRIKPTPTTQTEVTIILTDINDETPTFRSTSYDCEINENAQTNTPLSFIGNVRNEVYDYDQGNNGTFDLYLDPPNDIFDITPNRGVNEASFLVRVKNADHLDYEKFTELNFTLIAKEVVPNGKSSSVPVRIFIRDRNDNYPEFSQQIYTVTIFEDVGVGTVIAQVQASDKDSGNFGSIGIRYTTLSGSIAHVLNLNTISGSITLNSPAGNLFDREVVSRHYLTVEARDDLGNGNRNTAQLIINIADVNDNPPIFIQRKYEVRLFENKMSFETPLIVEAKDLDLNGTRNSEITYEILDGEFKENFTINPKTGVVTPIIPMNFEELGGAKENIKPIHLTVRASDSGVPVLSSKVPIIIYVQDVNDNAPQFEQMFYKKSIPEDLPGGTSVLDVKARDNDGSPPNNVIVYRIMKGGSDKFVIGSDSGIISVAQGSKLDPDLTDPKITEYSLIVSALDGGFGDNQLSATAIVNITILDINNKPPIFNDPGTVHINENTPVGTSVYRLIAQDFDENPKLRYHIDGNASEARTEEGVLVKPAEFDFIGSFDLNPNDGLIRVVKLLDREKVEQIKLGVVVEDMAAEKNHQVVSSFLTIIVDDENDNNPKFKNSFYKRSITENSLMGVTILNVVAFDVDKNRTISYSLEGPEQMLDLVHLNSESGEIVVANKIDRELYEWINMTVRATDSGIPSRSSLVDVFIQVIDENDNNPIFIGDVKNFTVPENSPIGTRIAMIEASDADSGDFGKITFLLDKQNSQGFSIDPDTGILRVTENLDRETKDLYMLVIEIWDNYQFGYGSGESRNNFRQIFVSVLDENDNVPELVSPHGCVQITEYHEINELVTTLKAKDDDDASQPNGKVYFEIQNGTDHDLFYLQQIDELTANLIAKKSFKGFYGNYTLEITMNDLGNPTNIKIEQVEVCVSDFNDHPPIFILPTHNATIRVPENATIGTIIYQVHASDEDEGLNALVKYRLKPDPTGNYRTFGIDQDTGMITVKLPLDRERQKIYEIRVEAYDHGVPTPLSSDLDLTVYVRNVNDYEPQFLVEEIVVNFTEHSRPGMERVKLPDTVDRDEVDDLDDPPTSVCYFIVHGNSGGHFRLDPEAHVLTLDRELDRELRANHSLIIKATEDCMNPPQNLTITSEPEALVSKAAAIGKDQQFSVRYKPNLGKYIDHYDRFKHSRNLRSVPETIEIPDDNTLVKIFINVLDINDNAPKFDSNMFTGGVTTAADFGTQFMHVKAIDLDEGVNAKITYYQVGEIRKTLTEGLDHLQKPPFLVDTETGAVQLNFDPQKGMKGYFDFTVLANDTDGLQDLSHVYIYLLREDQRVRFVLRQQPSELREHIHVFRSGLGNVTDAIVNVDEFKVHENKDGSVDKTKTDVYLHLVDKNDHSILEVPDILKLVDSNIEELDGLFKDFNVIDTQPAEPLPLIGAFGSGGSTVVTLVISNIFIAVLLIVILALCVSQRTSYRRQLRAARVNTYVTSSDLGTRAVAARVPNTNKHSMEGSNPIWLKAYSNEWFKNDDDVVSTNSGGTDSLDENVVVNEDYEIQKNMEKRLNGLNVLQNNLSRPYNVYQQIDKLPTVQILDKRLETTEL